MNKIIYKTYNINRDYANNVIDNAINFMKVPDDSLDYIYICDLKNFENTVRASGYPNILDTPEYTVYGIAYNKCIYYKDLLFENSDIMSVHNIWHEFGHILDDFYRPLTPLDMSYTINSSFNRVSTEYNAEKYCRYLLCTDLLLIFNIMIGNNIKNTEDKLIELKVNYNKNKFIEIFIEGMAEKYRLTSFLNNNNNNNILDNIFSANKPTQEYKKIFDIEIKHALELIN